MTTPPTDGMPRSLQRDGWWLTAPVEARGSGASTPPAQEDCAGHYRPQRFLIILALLVLADWLFWDHAVGLSLAIFAMALLAAMFIALDRSVSLKEGITGGAILSLSVLPIVEHVQPLSLIFYLAGIAILATWIGLEGQARRHLIAMAAVRFISCAPAQAVLDIKCSASAAVRSENWVGQRKAFILAWALPLLVGGIFVILLIAANPLMEDWANTLPMLVARIDFNIQRIAFWAATTLAIWPLFMTDGMRLRILTPFSIERPLESSVRPAIINPASVANSLVVFNLLFAVQTALDAAYLWGGVALPEGMTYAQYAHRGAYPLVATALLAGLFSLISRPIAEESSWLRMLLTLWLGQNLLLVLSSLYRLDLYVMAYGLTYWRIAAFIWMGLVAIGLILIGWQLVMRKTNHWLLQANIVVLIVTLYSCAFVNFASMIATYNLTLAEEKHRLADLDRKYICALGPTAEAAVLHFEKRVGVNVCPMIRLDSELRPLGWREWGFREWRVQRSIASHKALEPV